MKPKRCCDSPQICSQLGRNANSLGTPETCGWPLKQAQSYRIEPLNCGVCVNSSQLSVRMKLSYIYYTSIKREYNRIERYSVSITKQLLECMVTQARPNVIQGVEDGKMSKAVLDLKVLATWLCNYLVRSKYDLSLNKKAVRGVEHKEDAKGPCFQCL